MGVVIAGIFQGRSSQQESSFRELTEKEKSEAIKIAFDNEKVKEMVKGKEYSISYVNMTSKEQVIEGKRVLGSYPVVEMYIGGAEWVTKVNVLVDLDEKKVIDMSENPHVKPIPPKGVTEEEIAEAIKIALNNEIVKGKIEGLVYEIPWVDEIREESEIKRERPGERLGMVNVGIVGAMITYIVTVSPAERKVIRISELPWGGRMGREKSEEAYEIARNNSRVNEMIYGVGERQQFLVEYLTRDRVVGGKLLVDVYMHREKPEPEKAIVVTGDFEEEKVIGINEMVSWSRPEDYKVIYKQ